MPHVPAAKRTVAHFAAHLSLRGLAPATINLYITAVASLHKQLGLPDPCRHNHILALAKRGAAKHHTQPQRTRAPITPPILRRILGCLSRRSNLTRHDRRMLAAALTTAFHGFLRVSEFTTPSPAAFNPQHHATAADIRWHTGHFTFTLKFSKTDQRGHGAQVRIRRSGDSTCAHTAMGRFMARRPKPSPHLTPLFTFRNGTPLTPRSFRQHLHCLLHEGGYNADRYNTHSLRIGAATAAAQAGTPHRTIKQLGRWRSQAYQSYIRPPPPHQFTHQARHTTHPTKVP